MGVRRVCVYCASSQRIDRVYLETARSLGGILAKSSVTIVYGGGGTGSMGAVADGSLEAGGHVVGVIPEFMVELEWGHSGIQEMKVVDTLHERKRLMLEDVDACIALPGGSGTLEELLEAITMKRLGIYLRPIVLLNVRGFFDPLLEQFERCISEQFMDDRHRLMWRVVERPEDVLNAIESSPEWSSDARNFASLR